MPKPDSGKTPLRTAAAAAIGLLAATLLPGCTDKEKPAPPEPRLLVIDGIEIRFDELKPYCDWISNHKPQAGEKSKNVWVMRDYLLPLRVAERKFAKERAEQLELAKGLCEVATNVGELEQHTKLMQHKSRKNWTRSSCQLPVGMFLFRHESTFAVSPPIPVPQGYFVAGSFEYKEQPLKLADYSNALQVGFVTHTSGEWRKFWDEEKLRLADKVTFVHPDYRDNMPPWMKLPKETKKP